MMYTQNGAARYRTVRNHGMVADASPTRLVQIMFEHILSQLATAQGCMERIREQSAGERGDRQGQGHGQGGASALQLNGSLDMERGGQIAANLRAFTYTCWTG